MSKKGNIPVLSAGKRAELIRDFKAEAAKLSDGIRILAIDMNPCMPLVCYVSDGAFSVPSMQSENHIDRIFDLTVEEDIGLIVLIIDTELYKLSEARARFEEAGIHIAVSDSELVALCRDKRKTVGLPARHGIRPPEVYDRNHLVYPRFVKSHNGSHTIGARRLDRAADLTPEILADSKLMFCQLMDVAEEFQEFTADMYYDWKGRPKCAVPRERLEMRAGEVSKGATRRNSLYGPLTENTVVLEGARGCITAQFFFSERSGVLYGVEVNPRPGDDFPLTYVVGGNYPGWLTREYLYDEEIPLSDR